MNTDTLAPHQPVFPHHKSATHMPFFDGTTLLFCQGGAPIQKTLKVDGKIWQLMGRNSALEDQFKDFPRERHVRYRSWKLAYCKWQDKIIHQIETGMPEDGIQCSPAYYRDGDRVYVSFVGGVPSNNGSGYRLYACSGPDLDHLDSVKPLPFGPVFYGFVSPDHICWGAGTKINLKEKATGNEFLFKADLGRVLRVTFQADNSSKILITGIDMQFKSKTLNYDLTSKQVSEVSAEGDVYKSSLHGHKIIFAKKTGEGLEDRELYHGDFTLDSSTIQISEVTHHA